MAQKRGNSAHPDEGLKINIDPMGKSLGFTKTSVTQGFLRSKPPSYWGYLGRNSKSSTEDL